ncbi:Transforming growth factor beta regulator 1, partial [Paramuricea clavata]
MQPKPSLFVITISYTSQVKISQENAAIADEIVRTDAKFQRAKVERKFLLKQLVEYRSMPREPLPPPANPFVPAPPPEIPVDPPPEIKLPLAIPPPAKSKAIKVRIKKVAPPTKSKKETEGSAEAKGNTEETKSDEGITQDQDGKGDAPVKPKRKKPGTAIKRKVQPIPVDAKGKPVFPIVLGGLTVHSLGDIVCDRPGFHSERYIWPVGFCSSRYYPSMKTPDMKCIYTCKILDGGYGPTIIHVCLVHINAIHEPSVPKSTSAWLYSILKWLHRYASNYYMSGVEDVNCFELEFEPTEHLVVTLFWCNHSLPYHWVCVSLLLLRQSKLVPEISCLLLLAIVPTVCRPAYTYNFVCTQFSHFDYNCNLHYPPLGRFASFISEANLFASHRIVPHALIKVCACGVIEKFCKSLNGHSPPFSEGCFFVGGGSRP